MRQSAFYKFAAIFLLLLNLGLVAFFFATKPDGPPPGREKNRVEEMLSLDQQQMQEFLSSADRHKSSIKNLDQSHKTLLRQYFMNVLEHNENIDSEQLLSNIQKLEAEKIIATYKHLEDIKSILSKDQLDHYEEFVDHMVTLIAGNQRPHPPGRKTK